MIWTMQNTSTVANESENTNGLGQPTRWLMTNPQCDESDEFVTQDYHRVFLDDQGVLHTCLEYATTGIGRGESR